MIKKERRRELEIERMRKKKKMAKGHFGFGSATMTTHLLDANTSGPAVKIVRISTARRHTIRMRQLTDELIFSLNTTQSRMPIRFVSAAAIVSRSIGRLSGQTMVDSCDSNFSPVCVCVFFLPLNFIPHSLASVRLKSSLALSTLFDRSFRLSTG